MLFTIYDGEPIYVGQSSEQLRVRIQRHLTNQRTDAVAMNVLDPFEVYEIEMWPLWEFHDLTKKKHPDEWKQACLHLNAAEYSVFQKLFAASKFHALLNEKDIAKTEKVSLPKSVRACIIPEDLRDARRHPDVRIARRASTIAALAKVISERSVQPGLRRTLRTQAQRLEKLATERFGNFSKEAIEVESEGD